MKHYFYFTHQGNNYILATFDCPKKLNQVVMRNATIGDIKSARFNKVNLTFNMGTCSKLSSFVLEKDGGNLEILRFFPDEISTGRLNSAIYVKSERDF